MTLNISNVFTLYQSSYFITKYTCFNIDSNDPSVCNSNGVCFSTDSCLCQDNVSGNRCEILQFHWTPVSGSFSTVQNWLVKANNIQNATRLPNSQDSIYFDQPGNYTILVDISVLNFSYISIGSTNTAFVSLLFNSNIINFNTWFIDPLSTINATNSTFYFNSNIILRGNLFLMNYNKIYFYQNTLLGGSFSSMSNDYLNFFSTVTFENVPISAPNCNFSSDITLTGASVLQLQNSIVSQSISVNGNFEEF